MSAILCIRRGPCAPTCRGLQTIFEQSMQCTLSDFWFEISCEIIFGDVQIQHRIQQWHGFQARWSAVFDLTFDIAQLFPQRHVGVCIEECLPDGLPYQIRGVDTIRLARAAEADESFSTSGADHLRHESGLTQASFRYNANDLSLTFRRQIQPAIDELQFLCSSHHRQGIIRLLQPNGTPLTFTRHREYRQRLSLAFHRQGWTWLKGKLICDCFMNMSAD